MTVARMRDWREWLYQTFVRHGYFAVRPLPITDAEQQELSRFSDDGTHLTAKELWSYHFSSGEITFFIEWSADER